MRFIPSDLFLDKSQKAVKSALISRHLVDHYTHWQDPADPAKLLNRDPVTGEICYTAVMKGTEIKEIVRTSDGARLRRASARVGQFEDISYIHEWHNANGVSEIELPRFDLKFTLDPVRKRFVCGQKEGYFLNQNERIGSLGVFDNYLVLSHETGKKLVVIPKQKFKSPDKMEVLEPRYEIERQVGVGEGQKQDYFTYEINDKGELFSHKREAAIYLAQVQALVKKYDSSAATLLNNAPKLGPYSSQEIEILEKFIKLQKATGDQSGNALALRCYAGYCLLSNALMYQREIEDDKFKLITQNYKGYLQHLHHATAIQLEPSEEVLLLKAILNKDFDPLLFVRLRQLDPEYSHKITISSRKGVDIPAENGKVSPFIDFDFGDHSNYNVKASSSQITFLLTRPGKTIKNNFGYYFLLAKNGTEEQKTILRGCFPFLKHESDGKYRPLFLFLQMVLANPNSFQLPPPEVHWPEDKHKKWLAEVDRWKKEIRVRASPCFRKVEPSGQLAQHRNSPKQALIPEKNLAEAPKRPLKKNVGSKQKIALNLPKITSAAKETKKFFAPIQTAKSGVSANDMLEWVQKLQNDLKSKDPLEKNELARLEQDLQPILTNHSLKPISFLMKMPSRI